MVLMIECDEGVHETFYEGSSIGFHREKEGNKKKMIAVIEGRDTNITLKFKQGEKARLFLMNDKGKTIKTEYWA